MKNIQKMSKLKTNEVIRKMNDFMLILGTVCLLATFLIDMIFKYFYKKYEERPKCDHEWHVVEIDENPYDKEDVSVTIHCPKCTKTKSISERRWQIMLADKEYQNKNPEWNMDKRNFFTFWNCDHEWQVLNTRQYPSCNTDGYIITYCPKCKTDFTLSPKEQKIKQIDEEYARKNSGL